MSDFRVHVASAPSADSRELTLPPAESHHLVTVNRARVGDTVIAFDGRGTDWTCRLLRMEGKKNAVLELVGSTRRPPLPCAIILGQCLPKGGTMDDIVRQATELGAALIAPLIGARTEVHLDAERSEKKIEKWRVAAIEAAKQCGNPFLPDITPTQSVGDFVQRSPAREAELRAAFDMAGQQKTAA